VRLTNCGYVFNLEWFSWMDNYEFSAKFIKKFGPPRRADESITSFHQDMAASAQKLYEYVLQHCVSLLVEKTKQKNIALAGGAALNCTANGKLLMSGNFDSVNVGASVSDLGTSVGAAFLSFYRRNKFDPARSMLTTDALGPKYLNEEIEKYLCRSGVHYEYNADPAKLAAASLCEGLIVGWFNGAMEFGPRALGNRSILADPTKENIKDKINNDIKFREQFRPFAPMVIREYMHEYFNVDVDVPFMTHTIPIKEDKRSELPGVVHVDGTGRVQTVTQFNNAPIYALIKEFMRLSGVPVILNTSFNLAGEPIVCSPEDALRTFYTSGIDVLIMENYVVRKVNV